MESQPDTIEHALLKRLVCAAVAVLWPLIYFHRFLIPNRSFSLTLGNDFVWLYYKYKVYLLAALSEGSFPLWSPSEAAGFPFYSNPFAQAFYPLNLLLLAFFRLAGGYSIFDHQAFAIAGLSVYALGLYLWLSRLIPNRRAVMFAVLLMTVSFKLGEIIRFPNAVHAAAWMPWLLYGTALATDRERRKRAVMVLFVSSLMLLTAGYPYYAYYCIFLVVPYAGMMVWGGTRKTLMGDRPDGGFFRLRYIAALITPCAAAALLCSPYLLKMQALMGQTTDRGGADYAYSTSYPFHFSDTVGSLIFPPAAQTEGWYYFSIAGLLIIILFLVRCCLPQGASTRQRRLALMVTLWIALVSYLSYGSDSYLFDLFWSYFPGFSHLRAWGRLNIVMVPLIGLLLAASYHALEASLASNAPERRRALIRMAVVVISAGGVIAAVQWLLLTRGTFHWYWTEYFSSFHGTESRFLSMTLLACVVLVAILFWAAKTRYGCSKRWHALLLFLLLAVAVADMWPVGSQQWTYPASATQAVRQSPNIREVTAAAFFTPRTDLRETISLDARFNTGYLWNWYFHRYTAFHDRVLWSGNFAYTLDLGELPWMYRLLGLYDGTRIFVSQRVDQTAIQDFFRDSDATVAQAAPLVAVTGYEINRLQLQAWVNRPVYLSFIDNWDPDWRAWVNGRNVPMERLFGTFKSVRLEAGASSVEFAYCPFGIGERAAAEGSAR